MGVLEESLGDLVKLGRAFPPGGTGRGLVVVVGAGLSTLTCFLVNRNVTVLTDPTI